MENTMTAHYRIPLEQLTPEILSGIQTTFGDKRAEVEITVRELDETEYLLGSENNKKHLLAAIENIRSNATLIEITPQEISKMLDEKN